MVHWLDIAIVVAFFLATFAVGIWSRSRTTLEDYWVNRRSTGLFALVATVLSTFVGAGAILGNAGIAYGGGGLAVLLIGGSFFLYFLLFSLFLAPKIHAFGRKHKAYTVPDFLEARYSRKVRLAGAIVNLIAVGLLLALQMLAIGIFVAALTEIDPVWATVVGGLIVIAYTSVGGLKADIKTDVFQFIIMLSLLVLFLPLVIVRAGGFGAIAELPASYLGGESFAPWHVMILAFVFVGAGALASPDLWQRAYAAKSARTARRAGIIASILVLLFMVMAVLLGVFGKVLLPDATANTVVPELLRTLLVPGLYGLVLAGFFAAIMSSADTMLLLTSMTIVHDLYQHTRARKLAPRQMLRVSRYVTLAIGLLGLAVALLIFSVVHLSIEAASFAVVLLPSVLFGFYWKRATATAAFWSIVLGTLTIFAFLFISPVQAFIPGTLVSFLTFIIIAFSTKRPRRKPQDIL